MLLFSGQLYESKVFFYKSFDGICGGYWFQCYFNIVFVFVLYYLFVDFSFFESFLGVQVLCFVFLDS